MRVELMPATSGMYVDGRCSRSYLGTEVGGCSVVMIWFILDDRKIPERAGFNFFTVTKIYQASLHRGLISVLQVNLSPEIGKRRLISPCGYFKVLSSWSDSRDKSGSQSKLLCLALARAHYSILFVC